MDGGGRVAGKIFSERKGEETIDLLAVVESRRDRTVR